MARLNHILDSEEELPELSILLRLPKTEVGSISGESIPERNENRKSPRKKATQRQTDVTDKRNNSSNDLVRPSRARNPIGEQRPLGPLKSTNINSLFPPIDEKAIKDKTNDRTRQDSVRSSPRRKAKAQVDYSKFAPSSSDADSSLSESEDSFTDLSGFIVPDSASDDDAFRPKVCKTRGQERCSGELGGKSCRESSVELSVSPFHEQENSGPIDLTSPKKEKKISNFVCPESPPRFRTSSLSDPAAACSDLDEPFARLRFSPPRSKSPYKIKDIPRPVTPPLSPSKSKLQSPSKRNRVPPSPHRASIDAFWSADVINDWNEQYSPKKVLQSPRKNRLYPPNENEDELSPSESPRKTVNKSPTKRNKESIERKKTFDSKKHDLAHSFLTEVDRAIGDGQVSALAESTGGIKILWSKKLSSTAGRANWRKESLRTKNADGTVWTTTHRHHASIELAEKVIDDEDRLLNVLAHEYCHLANFMLSGIKNKPHGASFKQWAAKTTAAFADRGVKVTTKHTYEIDYKYVWVCAAGEEGCGTEYKRHSRSVDPERHSCGRCKGRLVQVKPVPRKKGEGQGGGNEFREFVKREWERVRREEPGRGFGEIMAVLGREFRERKGVDGAEGFREGGLGKRVEEDVEEPVTESGELDDVARKLDFLDLGA